MGLAYSLKFLWAPVVDRLDAPVFGRLGRRRSWMLLTKCSSPSACSAMLEPARSTGSRAIGALALLVAFSSSTQDIVVDAWRIEAAERLRRTGPAVGRVSARLPRRILVTDALILISASHFGWPFSYTRDGAC